MSFSPLEGLVREHQASMLHQWVSLSLDRDAHSHTARRVLTVITMTVLWINSRHTVTLHLDCLSLSGVSVLLPQTGESVSAVHVLFTSTGACCLFVSVSIYTPDLTLKTSLHSRLIKAHVYLLELATFRHMRPVAQTAWTNSLHSNDRIKQMMFAVVLCTGVCP